MPDAQCPIQGARALGVALALNAALTVLDVSDNDLRAHGLRALLEGVRAQQAPPPG